MLLDLKHGALLFFVAEWLFGIFLPTWTYIYASCCKRFSTFRSLLNHERRIVWVSLRSFFEDLDACTEWTAETKVGSNFQIRLFLFKTIFDRSSFTCTSDSPIQYADACYAPITKCQHIHNLSKSSETILAVGIKTCNSSVHEPWQYPKERGCLTVAFKCLFILNTQPGVSSSYVSVTEAAQQATNTLYQCSNSDVNGSSYLEVQPHYANTSMSSDLLMDYMCIHWRWKSGSESSLRAYWSRYSLGRCGDSSIRRITLWDMWCNCRQYISVPWVGIRIHT